MRKLAMTLAAVAALALAVPAAAQMSGDQKPAQQSGMKADSGMKAKAGKKATRGKASMKSKTAMKSKSKAGVKSKGTIGTRPAGSGGRPAETTGQSPARNQ
jgi:hypothetical protein